ncbi:hypothetical protein AB4Y67_11320 [Arthrobacter sp. YAF17]|uniref:hypothetical protein n=1 Tax=Arthrobacter sp. YAF17 TaxID=3233077 RepID=UPI003F924789
MSDRDLEAPGTRDAPNWNSLYRARGEEVSASRPVFTGDVFRDTRCGSSDDDANKAVLIMQHPCALRTNGVDLVPRLLVAEVRTSTPIPVGDWKGRFKLMPLPELEAEGSTHFAAHMHEPYLVDRAEIKIENRIACMSQVGVNLLLQRWVHHNSRVIVPTFEYQNVTAEQFEEADLVEDWCEDLASTPQETAAETAAAHEWLRGDSSEKGKSWQQLLENPQSRGTVRLAMRKHVKAILASR